MALNVTMKARHPVPGHGIQRRSVV